MKLNAMRIFRETMIVLPLAISSALFVLAVGIMFRMGVSHPLLRLLILGLTYLMFSGGVMLAFGVRKWWVLSIRAVVSGVMAAAFMVLAAESRFPHVLALAKVSLGEGGVVHKVGEARMHFPEGELSYSVYWGKVKYANGSDMRELILVTNDPVVRRSCFCRPMLLVGKTRILCAHGLSGMRISPGRAAVTCLGGIDITSAKVGADARLSFEDSDTIRTYRCELYEWDAKSSKEVCRTYYLDVPLSCFAEIGEDPQEKAASAEADGNDWSAAAKFISGPDFLGRAIGDQMTGGNEYDVKLEHPFLFLPRASYFGTADGGAVRMKSCVFWFKSPDVEYAIEHVLSPVTNALINAYGVPLTMSPDTTRGMCWKRDFSAVHKGQDVEMQVLLEGHDKTRNEGYETCLLIINVIDAGEKRRRRAWSKLARDFGESITCHRGYRDPIAVDEWHELSPDSIDSRWQFSRSQRIRRPGRSYIETVDGNKMLAEYVSGKFGIPFGMDVRTIEGFGGESLTPAPRKLLELEPNCAIETNGWQLVSVNVNGRALTVFGGTVRREFADESAAIADLKRVIGEFEKAANISMTMDASGSDRFVARFLPGGASVEIEIERIKVAADGTASYQIHITQHRLVRLIHIATTNGCFSEPE